MLQICLEYKMVFLLQCMQGSTREITTQQGAATAVALASPNGDPTAYFVGHNATLKIHSLSSGAQVWLHALVGKQTLPSVSTPLDHNPLYREQTLRAFSFMCFLGCIWGLSWYCSSEDAQSWLACIDISAA